MDQCSPNNRHDIQQDDRYIILSYIFYYSPSTFQLRHTNDAMHNICEPSQQEKGRKKEGLKYNGHMNQKIVTHLLYK